MEEYLDIYDEDLQHIGSAARKEVHEKGYLHQVVHCWIIGKRKPILYFQQRSLQKNDFAGYYDIACGGHIHAGETPEQAVMREIQEELGITLPFHQFIFLGKYRAPNYQIPGYYDRTISNVYVLQAEKPQFFLGDETEQMVWTTADAFYQMEVKNAEKIIVTTEKQGEMTILRDKWCCHDGEFQAKVLPFLKKAFP